MRGDGINVMADEGPLGVRGLTVRVPGEPEPVLRSRVGCSSPVPPEYDEDELADPGGCEF
ncbi:hypothetical protein ETD86_42235 [Nonomuraea turkmeniaca]|uniref:Uncharacterized protein n=1 Tax=Nonomuraea turkmeniaca TaxID=103838 RepID=A0A5S4F1E8_9ACTN|nr:hypothetical protein [Nonomuraea turkmeniaca]TMR09786.1 hypothetical protein ETD86_42235 [Nonomuraea turkmeniaca]